MTESVSPRVVEQRVRNRVIEVLEIASSFREQMIYQRNVDWINIPYELVNQWEDWVHEDPRVDPCLSDVYTTDEVDALSRFYIAWEAAAEALPNDYPTIAQAQQLAEWVEMREVAISCLEVFAKKGRMSEETEEL